MTCETKETHFHERLIEGDPLDADQAGKDDGDAARDAGVAVHEATAARLANRQQQLERLIQCFRQILLRNIEERQVSVLDVTREGGGWEGGDVEDVSD